MNYYLVNQNKTYNEEVRGEYMWAPILDKVGKKQYHWEAMKGIKDGDLVLNYCDRKISSYCITKGSYYNQENPFKGEELWRKDGRMVDCSYSHLSTPLMVDDHIEKLLELQEEKYGPFAKDRRIKQGYLFSLNSDLVDYMKECS